jgi:gluconate 2-dehydrogenase gamma chain
MNRRHFLECAALLVSGVSASSLGWTLTEEQHVHIASAANYTDQNADYFTPEQRLVVAAIAETIIPRTDTPGAIDAGVPRFIELMVADWCNDEEREIFRVGMEQLDVYTREEYGAPFYELDQKAQLQTLEMLEDQASDSPWYQLGNIRRDFISDAPFICQIKELTVWGFFTSEQGGTQTLRYEPMPMYFDGDIPLKPDDSTWNIGPLG